MKRSFPVRVLRQSLAVFLLAFLLAKHSFAQVDNVSPASTKFKPSGGSDCATCTCICIQGSIDFASLHLSGYPGLATGYGSKVGFNFGVFATHPIMEIGPGNLAVRGGLEFIQKGAKYSADPVKETVGLNYIELPIDALFQFPVMDNNTVFAGLGPYFAYGVGGKDKYSDGTTTESSSSFGSNGAKHFDFGLQFIGGFRLSCMASISLSYDLGLLNIANSNSNGSGYTIHDKNGVFSINLSYCLGGLMNK